MRLFIAIVLIYSMQTAIADIHPERQEELRHMLLHDCGSCHGMTMKGGLGPALTEDKLRDRTAAALESTVTYGRPGTPMPPFKDILKTEEIQWLVQLLMEQNSQ